MHRPKRWTRSSGAAFSELGAAIAKAYQAIPRFAGKGSNEAFVAWRRFPAPNHNTVGFARSTDHGATWSAPVNLSAAFFTMDQVLGNDRVNTNPSLAVDTGGPFEGNVYVVYANNDNRDGADVVFQRSTDEGLSFSAPIRLNARPGNDRAQWFPWVTVDSGTGQVHVFYYDQGIAAAGDLTEVSHLRSDDGGVTWHAPRPLSERPFHAGWGNDTGQPNLGDYNQAVAQAGTLFRAVRTDVPATRRVRRRLALEQPHRAGCVPGCVTGQHPQCHDGQPGRGDVHRQRRGRPHRSR
jgi:hypothetical protein